MAGSKPRPRVACPTAGCGELATPGHLCRLCQRRRDRERLRAAGRCQSCRRYCGGAYRCSACRPKLVAAKRADRAERVEYRQCPDCPNPAAPHATRCSTCLARRREKYHTNKPSPQRTA